MAELAISNIVNISVSQAQAGVGDYNTSNLGLFTHDTPNESFGEDGYKIYVAPGDVATDFGTDSTTYAMANAVFSQKPNILAGNGYLVIMPLEVSETLAEAITRTEDLVQYFGLMSTQIQLSSPMLAAAAVVQALNKIAFFVQRASNSMDNGILLDLLKDGNFTQSRGLYYGADTDVEALTMQAAYAGRALSVNFNGSNTTETMHLKDLLGVLPDPSMTQALLEKSETSGADIYASFQGTPKVYCNGANMYFDQVYNLQWFVGALQVAGFNYLAQSSTKVPQTEDGMDGLKSAYRKVCEQARTNQYAAGGSWNSSTTFGNQASFLDNILQLGYYIYSQPIALQSQSAREAREAPLVQIALKEAGAIQKSSVIIYVNA